MYASGCAASAGGAGAACAPSAAGGLVAEPPPPRCDTAPPPPDLDYSEFDIVKATQYGAIARVKELVDAGWDVNRPDAETVTLLHWAAINNRKAIIKYFLEKGAIVDAIGGELGATPLHWATRQGKPSVECLCKYMSHRPIKKYNFAP